MIIVKCPVCGKKMSPIYGVKLPVRRLYSVKNMNKPETSKVEKVIIGFRCYGCLNERNI